MAEDARRRDDELDALRLGLDLGLALIDTAEMYADGDAEELVGEAIRGRRDEVFLVSKVLPSNGRREATLRACEATLGRLGTDRIDLYLLHWRGSTPLEETLDAFSTLVDEGALDTVAGHHHATPAQVALAWVLRHDGVFTVPKAGTPAHVRENAGALDLELTAEDLDDLDGGFPPPTGPQPLEML